MRTADENGLFGDVTLYGLDRFPFGEVEVYEGEADPDKLWEKLSTGKYLVYAAPVDDNGKVQTEWIKHHVGDQVTLVMEDGTTREFEILALIKENFIGLTNRMSSEFSYYTASDVFKEMASEKFLMSYSFDVEDEKEAAFSDFVEKYTTQEEPLMGYESKQIWLEDFASMTDLFLLVGGMLALEGLYYAGITIIASSVLGCLFSLTAVRALSTGLWFMKYHFVLWPMLQVFPVLLLLGILVPVLAYRPQRKMSLVEMIRRNE